MDHLSLIVKNNFQIKALNQGKYTRKGRWAVNPYNAVTGRGLSETISVQGRKALSGKSG